MSSTIILVSSRLTVLKSSILTAYCLSDYVFTPEDVMEPASSHTLDVSPVGWVGQQLMEAGMNLNGNFIIGEWSCALSDTSLQGEIDPTSARRQFCEEQAETYRDVGGGAHFWSEWFSQPFPFLPAFSISV